VSGEWFAQAGLAIRASLTSGAKGRSSGRESAPKDKSERIRLLIAWWGARRTSHLGPVLLRHLRFEIGRRGWARGPALKTFVSGVHDPKIMVGMLVKVLRGDSIATRGRLARKGNVTFEDLMRGTSDFDVRTVTVEGLTSVRYLLPITVGIVTVIVPMRSAGLSWSHDTCCIDGEIGWLSNESISEPLPSGVRRCRTAFMYQRKALSRWYPRWRRCSLQQVFGAMHRRSGSHWQPGQVVTVTRLKRAAQSTRDLLNTLAAITCNEAGCRSLGDAWADTTTAHGRAACYQAAIQARGGAARSSEITRVVLPKVRHCTNGHGHLFALTILIGPDRCTMIRLPLASLAPTA